MKRHIAIILMIAALSCARCFADSDSTVTATNITLNEATVTRMLTAAVQQQFVGNDGELDLRFTQPWVSTNAPAGPLSVKILDMPSSGVTSSFIIRFDIVTPDGSSLGDWQMPVQAHLWREIFTARSMLQPGELVADADIGRERRDVLALHAPLAEITDGDTLHEISESVPAGSPVFQWAIKLHPVIHRGEITTAKLQDGALTITMKVEALEDGTPGQTIRLRNLDSDHDFSGTVFDESTVLVSL